MPKVRIASGLAKVLWCFLVFLIPAARAGAADVTLSWDPNPESDLAGYKIYYGTSSSVYSTSIDVKLVTTYTVTGLASGTYFFAITAYNTAGLESGFSNEVSAPLGPPDTTAPIISDIMASSITGISATIRWTTDEVSDSQVDYGTTTSYGSSTTLDAGLVTAHSQVLAGLSPGTTYYFRVRSKDAAGNLRIQAAGLPFTTLDTIAPVIFDVRSSNITGVGATITWSTDEASDSQVDYGITPAFGSSTVRYATMVTAHSQALTGLLPVTTYYFRVKSGDAGGNLATSSSFTFTTTNGTVPVISAVASTNITDTGAIIAWTTNQLTDSQVDYGTTPSYGSSTVLNTGMVISHSQALTGLLPGTTYYFQVKSRDAAGNLAVLAGLPFTTADTKTPVISAVTIINITSTGATIAWTTTDDASDSQVDYGTSASYGSSTPLNTGLVTSHSQALSGLLAATTYHFRIKSRDAAGNLAVSEDYLFASLPTQDTVAIASISCSGIDHNSATITWTTSKLSDQQVDYGLSAAYDTSTLLNPSLRTLHTETLDGLTANTVYHFRVRSRDGVGGIAVSPDFTFTTAASADAASQVTLVFPHPYAANDLRPALATDAFLGLAISNLDNREATLTFTAYGIDGRKISGPNLTNPSLPILEPAGGQIPKIDYQLFDAIAGGLGQVGWIEMQANVSKIAGFFMVFDSRISILDGALPMPLPMTSSILPEVGDQGFTRIQVVNPSLTPATALFEVVKSDGDIRISQNLGIQPMGSITTDLFAGLFPQTTPQASDYVRVTSDSLLLPLEIFGQSSQYVQMLNAQDATQGGTTLYCPQYAVGGGWRSALTIVNLDAVPGQITLALMDDNGNQIGITQTLRLEKYGKVYVDDPAFFQPHQPPPNDLIQGYVKIVALGIHVAGSVVFSDAQRTAFSSALPLTFALEQSMVFSHIASNATYYTGISLINPDSVAAAVTIEVYRADGIRVEKLDLTIDPRKRITELLTELFPSLKGQDWISGYVRVTADRGISAFALFGTHNLTALSAIPQQIAR
jgi:fibronectin type 3 domain-containing protein